MTPSGIYIYIYIYIYIHTYIHSHTHIHNTRLHFTSFFFKATNQFTPSRSRFNAFWPVYFHLFNSFSLMGVSFFYLRLLDLLQFFAGKIMT